MNHNKYNVQARRDLSIYLRSVSELRRGTDEAYKKFEAIKTQAVIAIFKADATMWKTDATVWYGNRRKNAATAETLTKLSKLPVIAIVDDDDSFRRATMSFIRSLGYAVLPFASAEAFLKSDRLRHTDCVISDVQMPAMNGLELQKKLIVQGPRLPIIFVTAFPEMRARAQALSAGAIGFLAKPFSDEELIACLNEALAVRGAFK
jgi:CheY-like chemotaxis protein